MKYLQTLMLKDDRKLIKKKQSQKNTIKFQTHFQKTDEI
jgi:hypothetical protein